MVSMLSERWGWYPTREPQGKVVWCELSAKSATPEGSGEVPLTLLRRRRSRPQDVLPAQAVNDPQLLRRVRDGLRDLDVYCGY